MNIKTIAAYLLFAAFFCLCAMELASLWKASAGRDIVSVLAVRSLEGEK